MGRTTMVVAGSARSWARRYALVCLVASSAIGMGQAWGQAMQGRAQSADSVKIVGIGASSCADFLQGVTADPAAERDYMAWAQGFMSGVLLRAPTGRDVDLDLLPSQFPLARQAEFLRRYCEANGARDFSDAVIELYRVLRMPPS